MAKASDVHPKITLACQECKERNYITKKNRRNNPDRLELKSTARAATPARCTKKPADPPVRHRGRDVTSGTAPPPAAGRVTA